MDETRVLARGRGFAVVEVITGGCLGGLFVHQVVELLGVPFELHREVEGLRLRELFGDAALLLWPGGRVQLPAGFSGPAWREALAALAGALRALGWLGAA